MLAGQYALLPENKAGFWVDKMFVDGRLIYIVFHQGMAEFCDSISDAKQRLRDRFNQLTLRQFNESLTTNNPSNVFIPDFNRIRRTF